MSGCDRLCDLQAIFLVEVFALNFARRCSRAFSARFIAMFSQVGLGMTQKNHKANTSQLVVPPVAGPPSITNLLLEDPPDDSSVHDRWLHWVRLSVKYRLLVCCYLVESRHHPMLPPERKSPSIQIIMDDLHFPSHETLWEAQDPQQWWLHTQEYSMMPSCIAEAIDNPIAGSYDVFQSSVLIAALYPPFSYGTPHLQPAVEHLLHDDLSTKQQLAIAKLVQLAPIRALLAVSGESWILGTKVTSQEEFAKYETELHLWVAHLWSSMDDSQSTMEALRLSVKILASSLNAHETSDLGFNDLGLLFAGLVLWAATAAASDRVHASGVLSQHQSSLAAATVIVPVMAPGYHAASSSTGLFAQLQQAALSVSSDRRSSIPHAEITADTQHFLSTAVEDITSFNVGGCQSGCRSALLWIKMQLHGSRLNGQYTDLPDHHASELIKEATGLVERILSHRWEDWGV
jgi:hypothetical protein